MVRSGRAHSTPGKPVRSRPGIRGHAPENLAAPAFGADSAARLIEGSRLERGDGQRSIPSSVVRRSVQLKDVPGRRRLRGRLDRFDPAVLVSPTGPVTDTRRISTRTLAHDSTGYERLRSWRCGSN